MAESLLVGTFLSYLVSLAAGMRQEAISEARQKKESDKLARDTARIQAIQDRRSLEEQLRLVGTNVARTLDKLGEGERERRLFDLLTDDVFQGELADWLVAWDPAQRKEAESAVIESLGRVLGQSGEAIEQVRRFKTEYMPLVEKALFQKPVLARWRLTLGMSAAIERIDDLGRIVLERGDEVKETLAAELGAIHHRLTQMSGQVRELDHAIARRYTEEQRRAAVDRYRELALEAFDIVDLANLPESDRHMAAKELTLRRLYVPLRVSVEIRAEGELTDEALAGIEARRDAVRHGAAERESDSIKRSPVGERLAEGRRLVVLGDPGAGKTTLLRWIATAYLLRLKQDPAFHDIPDVVTLPDSDWLPILVRCRDLDAASLSGAFDDVFRQTFRKSEMSEAETEALQAVLREMFAEGDALLLVDGLDEIATPAERASFCRQIERLHIAYPNAPIVVTSRIVGYREMGYQIGRGRGSFEHLTVADFSKEDKDDFARRWCEVVESPERRKKVATELIHDVHSTDRIERLTGNPMLLTTLALVKRKVGKLPTRRADLYNEAVQVLLNWRSEVDEPINSHEAIPQLEYLAYEMCRQGRQRLREDEVLDLFEGIRRDFPNLRRLRDHPPAEFLRLLERRTGILIESGRVKHEGLETAVFEFRHLTFQEYLAGRALAYGRFPGRVKGRGVAENVAPLAGQTQEPGAEYAEKGHVVTENWREALRLCVSCREDDAEEVVLAILEPREGEDRKTVTRARAIMAALCLADEPNVGDDVARHVLTAFAKQISEKDGHRSPAEDAAMQLGESEWGQELLRSLAWEFRARQSPRHREPVGWLCSCVGAAQLDSKDLEVWLNRQLPILTADDSVEAIQAALVMVQLAFEQRAPLIPGLIDGLMRMLEGAGAHPAAWALSWFSHDVHDFSARAWRPSEGQLETILQVISDNEADKGAAVWIIHILGFERYCPAINVINRRLHDGEELVRKSAAKALGNMSDPQAMEVLLAIHDEPERRVRESAVSGLKYTTDDEIDRTLLSKYLTDHSWSSLDPKQAVDLERVEQAAQKLKLPIAEVRRRYEGWSKRSHGLIRLAWSNEE